MILTRAVHYLSRFFTDENLTKKAYLNILNNILSYLVKLGVLFIITPLMVTGLGTFVYGLWQIINRTVGYITPASGRPTEALQWVIANRQTSKDYVLKQQYLTSAIVIWGIFLPIMVVIGAVISWFTPQWFNIPIEYYQIVRITSLLLVVNVSIQTFSDLPQSVLRGENLGYKRMIWTILLTIAGGVATWLALYFNTGIIGISVAVLVTTIINGILYVFIARHFIPWFGFAKPTKNLVRQFLGLSGWFIGWNLILTSMYAIDVVLLGLLGSVELVTIYTLTKYVPEILINLIQFLSVGVAPGLGGIVGEGNLKRASQLRSEMMVISWLVSTAVGATVLIWNRAFMGLWVGLDKYAGSIATLVIIFVVFQFTLIQNDAAIIDVTLKLNKKVIIGTISVLLTIVFVYFFVHVLNLAIVGISLGLLSGRLILSLGYPLIVGRSLEIDRFGQFRKAIRPAIVTVLLLSLSWGITTIIPATSYHGLSGWALFMISALISFCLLFALAFILGMNRSQRSQVLTRMKMIFKFSSTK